MTKTVAIHESLSPEWAFETSWEVCNKVGGINTVIATKARVLNELLKDRLIMIGPDLGQGTGSNPLFLEDKSLFPEWKDNLKSSKLKVRIGRWQIPGTPTVFLIDFADFFSRKDDILTQFWNKYRVDSMSGGWDYVEPVIFGYVAGRVIESFHHFHLTAKTKVIAQFHEWMTASGLLYLKDNMPQVGTVFTTHATVLGRCIAGNNFPLYDELKNYDPQHSAETFNVVAKHSMERQAAHYADVFTTVSEITAKECEHFLGKIPDMITPNGFEMPQNGNYQPHDKRKAARKKLLEVAEAVLNQPVSEDSLLVVKSGRYEFRNKGVDVFLDALHKLNTQDHLNKKIIAFLALPAGNAGPIEDVKKRIGNRDFETAEANQYLTHYLTDYDGDPIIRRIRNNNLNNLPSDSVKVIFAPVYLDGDDGIFDMDYYDLLPGFDFAAFPSYYEPWGYTPLESLALGVPAVTTNVAGFGSWISHHLQKSTSDGVYVVERSDYNQDECSGAIAHLIAEYTKFDHTRIAHARESAARLAHLANWEEFVVEYMHGYSKALRNVAGRGHAANGPAPGVTPASIQSYFSDSDKDPGWRKLYVNPKVPPKLHMLQTLAYNLWTNWNHEARRLFESIDPANWIRFKNNPTAALEAASFTRLQELEDDEEFCERLAKVEIEFNRYMREREKPKGPQVAYFCMEYGLDHFIKLYSGGLGVLAGDYLKEASDSKANMVAVGLLYRHGYFKQTLAADGSQQAIYKPQKFSYLPVQPVKQSNGTWLNIFIELDGRDLFAKVWKLQVGSVTLYLLDTDVNLNSPEDRFITHQLYGGDWDNRLKQELLLGLGGIRLLKTLGHDAEIYHCNEGHAAFTGLERIRHLIHEKGLGYDEAVEVVRASSLFTTHTPVPAGHDAFSETEMLRYFGNYTASLQINWHDFMALGRSNPNDHEEKFSMSFLATRLSSKVNGVSKLHGLVSKDIFRPLCPGYFTEEVNIDYVTNGVHYPTWASEEWQQLYKTHFGKGFIEDQHNSARWEKIWEVPDETIWRMRIDHKRRFVKWVKDYLTRNLGQKHQSPKVVMSVVNNLNEHTLIIGFARRFATYKRATLLLNDLQRLNRIVNDPAQPVVFIFAGKAHPKDIPGQDLIKRIVEISNMPEFLGKIIFLENYEMNVARNMVRGVDIWLNTPQRPMEASGTSGMKATLNGVLNLSVLDGWWAEGYKPGTGWALPEKEEYDHEPFQNEFDAETIYHLIEKEIKPLYYEKANGNFPFEWVQRIKKTIAEISPEFTMSRVVAEYHEKFYIPLQKQKKSLQADNYKSAREIAAWKKRIMANWDGISVDSMNVFDSVNQSLELGESFEAEVVLNIGSLSGADLAVEVMFIRRHRSDEVTEIISLEELKLEKWESGKATYHGRFKSTRSGVFEYSFRVYPTNKLLTNRMEMPLIKWI